MNVSVNLATSGARSATFSVPVRNPDGAALHLIVDITDEDTGAGVGSLTVTVQGIDPNTGTPYTLLASAALNAVGQTVLKVGPGLPVSANASANDVVPRDLNVLFTHGNANPMIYSATMHLIDLGFDQQAFDDAVLEFLQQPGGSEAALETALAALLPDILDTAGAIDVSGGSLTVSGGALDVSGGGITFDGDSGANAFRFATGAEADGQWRMVRSGNNLLVQRREAGVWTTKQTFTP